MPFVQKWFPLGVLIVVASCQQAACPSPAGGACNPRNADCPAGYTCGLAEFCTRTCEQTSDCWVKVSTGCRYTEFPGQRLADGGTFMENTESEDGFCPETKVMECIEGYCQRFSCADGGCDYDLYGPSPNKGNRDQGPAE